MKPEEFGSKLGILLGHIREDPANHLVKSGRPEGATDCRVVLRDLPEEGCETFEDAEGQVGVRGPAEEQGQGPGNEGGSRQGREEGAGGQEVEQVCHTQVGLLNSQQIGLVRGLALLVIVLQEGNRLLNQGLNAIYIA